jgi:hypothetical protein
MINYVLQEINPILTLIRQSMESFSIMKISMHILIINIVYKHCAEEIKNKHLFYHTDTGKYYVQS